MLKFLTALTFMACVLSCQKTRRSAESIVQKEIRSESRLSSRILPTGTIKNNPDLIMYSRDRIWVIKFIYFQYLFHRDELGDFDFFESLGFIAQCGNFYFGFPDVASNEYQKLSSLEKEKRKLAVYIFYVLYERSSLAFNYAPDGFDRQFWNWFMRMSKGDFAYVYQNQDFILLELNSYTSFTLLEQSLLCSCGTDYFGGP